MKPIHRDIDWAITLNTWTILTCVEKGDVIRHASMKYSTAPYDVAAGNAIIKLRESKNPILNQKIIKWCHQRGVVLEATSTGFIVGGFEYSRNNRGAYQSHDAIPYRYGVINTIRDIKKLVNFHIKDSPGLNQ